MESKGQLALITGGNRGLGFEAAKKLAWKGFRVVITSRSAARADEAARRICDEVKGAAIRGMALDLASLTAVRAFAQRFAAEEPALYALVANAAHWPQGRKQQFTRDGFEMTFGTNHLGHFLLTTTLLPLLEAGAKEAREARVVVVSSRLHRPGSMGAKVRFDFDDLDLRRDYDPEVAYKNSKLANLWFTYELNRRVAGTGITANPVCPGFVPETEAERSTGLRRLVFKHVMPRIPFSTSLDAGSDTYVFAASDSSLKGVGGKFYAEQREIASSPESYDLNKAARLWQVSEKLAVQ